jgi:hypothetical protein
MTKKLLCEQSKQKAAGERTFAAAFAENPNASYAMPSD